jgi:hypothetical protein
MMQGAPMFHLNADLVLCNNMRFFSRRAGPRLLVISCT